jgi:hypothetical protein
MVFELEWAFHGCADWIAVMVIPPDSVCFDTPLQTIAKDSLALRMKRENIVLTGCEDKADDRYEADERIKDYIGHRLRCDEDQDDLGNAQRD